MEVLLKNEQQPHISTSLKLRNVKMRCFSADCINLVQIVNAPLSKLLTGVLSLKESN
jgi:hypothetical protein